MSELKRCPFCGGEARLQKPYRKRGWYVICKNTNCGCRTPFYQHLYTSEDDLQTIATMVWNNRKPMERIVERLEEYRDDFMNDVYEELREDADKCRANRIIDRFDEVTEILKEEG